MRKSEQTISILIVLPNSLTDIILASPIAEVLKFHLPNSRVVWVTQPGNEAPLVNNPYIDEIVLWDRNFWLSLWRKKKLIQLLKEIKQLQAQLNKQNFELAIDLQGLLKSALIAKLSGAKEKIGMSSKEGSHLFMDKVVSKNIANRDQLGSEYRYLVNRMGYSDRAWQIHTYPTDEQVLRAGALISASIRDNERYIVICPFANRSSKNWTDKHWQQLVLRIRGRYHLKCIILGGREEGTKGQQLSNICGAINLAGQTSLVEAAEILKHAELVVGVDNPLTHLSQASDTPSVALFGPSRPYLYSGTQNNKVLYLEKNCSPCGNKPICKGAFHCMRDITPDSALLEIKKLLDEQSIISKAS